MAYFSNSSDGDILDMQCDECIHEDSEAGCPIALVQMSFNYDQLNNGNKDLKRAMDMLIKSTGICQMKRLIDKYYTKNPLTGATPETPKYKKSKGWGS